MRYAVFQSVCSNNGILISTLRDYFQELINNNLIGGVEQTLYIFEYETIRLQISNNP